MNQILENTDETYIIGRYNPSARIIDRVSHNIYIVCVNLIHKWRDLQFKVNSERQIFEKLFMAILFTLRVFARNLLKGNRRRNTFSILFWCLARTTLLNRPRRLQTDENQIFLSTITQLSIARQRYRIFASLIRLCCMTLSIYWSSLSGVKDICEHFDIVWGFRQTLLYYTTFSPSSREIFCEMSLS